MQEQESFHQSAIFRHASKHNWPMLYNHLATKKGKASILQFQKCFFYIIFQRPSKAVVKKILKTDPDALMRRNDDGMLPLHIACRHGAHSDIIKTLLNFDKNRGKQSAMAVDHRNNNPLRYLLEYLSDPMKLENVKANGTDSVSGTCSIISSDDFEDYLDSIKRLATIAPMTVYHKNRRGRNVFDFLTKKIKKECRNGSTCDWKRVQATVHNTVVESPEMEFLRSNTMSNNSCDWTVISNFPDEADDLKADLSAPNISRIDTSLISNLADDGAVSQTKSFMGLKRHFLRRWRRNSTTGVLRMNL